MRRLSVSILCLLFLCRPALADDRSDVEELLKEKIDVVVLLLQDKALDKTTRDERIIGVVTPIFDFEKMAQLSLGKKYWPGLSAKEREAFSDLFIERLQESYLEKLDLYTDEEVRYGEPQQVKKRVHIETSLVSKDDLISILYKFYRARGGWQIYDVVIEGVSLIQTYRSQFDGVLKKGTIDDLMEKLRIKGEFTVPSGSDDATP